MAPSYGSISQKRWKITDKQKQYIFFLRFSVIFYPQCAPKPFITLRGRRLQS